MVTLGELAKASLKAAEDEVRRNVFISFAMEDKDAVELLRGQAKNDNVPFEFSDFSVRVPFDSEDADYLRARIRARIERSSVTLVYLTEDAAASQWVNWEVDESVRMGKGVIGVHAGESPPSTLPRGFLEHDLKVVQWKHERLADAIREASESRGERE